jgi:hypothetical protein
MAVRLDDGRQVAFDLKDYAHVDHGYAATIHKSQGVTVDRGMCWRRRGWTGIRPMWRCRGTVTVQLHYGRDDFADDRRLVRTLGRERAKDMASDYPMYRDRDAEAQSFADRRGLSGEIRVADAPERKGVDLAPRAEPPPDGRGSRPRDIGDGRGAGEAKAAAERQPRRGMFDGFGRARERTGERTAEPRQGAKERRLERGMFDGLKLPSRTPAPTPAKERQRVPSRAMHDFRRAVERASRSAEAVLQAHASGGPVEHQKVALERGQALDQIRAGASRDLASAMQRDPALLREAAAGRSGPMIEAMAQEAACAPIPICAPIGSWNAGNSSPRTATGFIAPAT